MKKLLILAALSQVNAWEFPEGSIAIEPYAKSYHYDKEKDTNENHKYFGIVYRTDHFEFGGATFVNSHYERSNALYVGYRDWFYEGDFKFGLWADAGYKSGYDTSILFYGGPILEYKDFYLKIGAGNEAIVGTVGVNLLKF